MKKSPLALAITTLLLSSFAQSADIHFSGYGSIRAGLVLDDEHFPNSFNYDDDIDFKEESVFALQAQTQLNNNWSATLVLQASGQEDFEVEARWAYLNYEITPETTITMGRFALPYFRNSDTQDIGYSHNYSVMPRAIYQGQEFDVIEGVRIMHSTFIGDGDITIKGSYGSFSGEIATDHGDAPIEINNIMQLSAEYTYEWFSIFVGGVSAEADIDIDSQFDAALMVGLPGYTVSDGIAYNPANIAVYDMSETYADEDDTLYLSTGFSIDYEQWLFNAEYATYQVDDSFNEQSEAIYLSLGYRFDKTVITLVHEDVKFSDDYDNATSSDPYVNGFLKSVNDSFAKPDEYDAQGIHIRYDAAENIAYKFEYTYASDDLANESASVVTFGVDFIF
jgi:hypothetical protein